jgi:hypothetical protein
MKQWKLEITRLVFGGRDSRQLAGYWQLLGLQDIESSD